MKKQINIVLNGEKGSGKTFFATHFIQFLKDRQISHRSIGTDIRNAALKRFHHETDHINIRNVRGIDLLFGALQYTGLVVADCHAESTEIFLDYFTEVRVFEILEMVQGAMTIIFPVMHEPDSIKQLARIVEKFQAQCRYLIVKNQMVRDDFSEFERSDIWNRVMKELEGREMLMPKLYDWLVNGLNESELSVTDAIKYPGFSLVDRQRLKNWQHIFNDQLGGVCDILLSDGNPASVNIEARKASYA